VELLVREEIAVQAKEGADLDLESGIGSPDDLVLSLAVTLVVADHEVDVDGAHHQTAALPREEIRREIAADLNHLGPENPDQDLVPVPAAVVVEL